MLISQDFLILYLRWFSEKVPRKFLTFLVVLLGIIFSMFYEVGYVILIPLAAILFMNLGRHPSAGICAAFSGITFGYGANVIINRLDSMLTLYSGKASKVLDSAYNVNLYGNIIFTAISMILVAYVGMVVTERFIIPKLGSIILMKRTFTMNVFLLKKRERVLFFR